VLQALPQFPAPLRGHSYSQSQGRRAPQNLGRPFRDIGYLFNYDSMKLPPGLDSAWTCVSLR
jgi:hypothetical protein